LFSPLWHGVIGHSEAIV